MHTYIHLIFFSCTIIYIYLVWVVFYTYLIINQMSRSVQMQSLNEYSPIGFSWSDVYLPPWFLFFLSRISCNTRVCLCIYILRFFLALSCSLVFLYKPSAFSLDLSMHLVLPFTLYTICCLSNRNE